MSIDNYIIDKELGRGTFGVTYLGEDRNTGGVVAIKTIDVQKSAKSGANINDINDEINTLKELAAGTCSRYIACYYGSFDGTLDRVETIFIVSEFIDGGSFTKFIEQYGKSEVNILWPVTLQLLLGLQFIHNRGYAHRDIKPDNILITKDFTIKYIDFGLACLKQCRINSCMNTCHGTPGTLLYMPPEFFSGQRQDSLEAAKAHDVWSLSLVLFELYNGLYNFPFNIRDSTGNFIPPDEIQQHIMIAPEFGSNYLLDDGRTNRFLDGLLVNNWEQRPKVLQAIARFLNNVMARIW